MEALTDGSLRARSARDHPDHRRDRPDDGRGLRRAARDGAINWLAVAFCSPRRSRSSGRRRMPGPSSTALSPPTCSRASARRSCSPLPRSPLSRRWLVRARDRACVRICRTDPVRRGRHERDGLGDQPDSLYVGLELKPRRLRPRLLSPHVTSDRPRPASNISSSARSRAGSCFTESRCSTALRDDSFAGVAAAFGRGAPTLGLCSGSSSCSPASLSRSARCRSTCGPRRLRRRADAGHRLLRLRTEGGRVLLACASASKRSARRPMRGGRS